MKLVRYASSSIVVSLILLLLPGCGKTTSSSPLQIITPTSGSSQSTAINTAFSAPLVGTVTIGGTPVSGAIVTFTAPISGASGTFAGASNTVTVTASSAGVATSPAFTANTIAGTYSVIATVSGVTGSGSFSLTNTAATPAAITATSGTPQSATINTAFAQPLVATVVDSSQNLVSGAVVTFTAPATGASGTFAGASNTVTATTDSNGLATSPAFTANATTGAYTVAATVSGVATAANFKLSNINGQPKTITATSGTPQSAAVKAAFAAPLVATVTASDGTPLSGVVVTFKAPAASTGASGTFAGGVVTATTDTNGVATSAVFTANGTTGTYTVTGSIAGVSQPADFTLTNSPLSFSFYLTGLESSTNFYAVAGAITIDGNGNVLGGEQDYNDGLGITSPQPSGDTIGGGTVTINSQTGRGTITLVTNNANLGTETIGVQFVNANHALIVQFDGLSTSSGSMDAQTLSAAPSGGYAFTLAGVDFNYVPVVYGGVFSIGGTGLTGVADMNDSGTITIGKAFTGTVNPPDAYGRGIIPGVTPGDKEIVLSYYVVGPEALRIIDVDPNDAGIGSAYGQGSGGFSNASLSSAIFGVQSNSYGALYAAVGQFATDSTAGTFSGVADSDELDSGIIVSGAAISGPYSVSSNGYGSLTISNGSLGDLSIFGIYLTDPNLNLNDPNNTSAGTGGGVLAELDPSLNGTGILLSQTDTTHSSFTGPYAFGGQDFNFIAEGAGWEFDFAGSGTVSGLTLTGNALISDPFDTFNSSPTLTGRPFSGTATSDGANAGRYIFPLAVTVAGVENDFATVIYQADGSQLLWLDEDEDSVFLGSFQQQGSLTGIPVSATKQAARRTGAPPRPAKVF